MPPCGYRAPAVNGLTVFLRDNLSFFIELHRGRGDTIAQAFADEAREIEEISSRARGGPWSACAVELNRMFYAKLAQAEPQDWSEVQIKGSAIIREATTELSSLLASADMAA